MDSKYSILSYTNVTRSLFYHEIVKLQEHIIFDFLYNIVKDVSYKFTWKTVSSTYEAAEKFLVSLLYFLNINKSLL